MFFFLTFMYRIPSRYLVSYLSQHSIRCSPQQLLSFYSLSISLLCHSFTQARYVGCSLFISVSRAFNLLCDFQILEALFPYYASEKVQLPFFSFLLPFSSNFLDIVDMSLNNSNQVKSDSVFSFRKISLLFLDSGITFSVIVEFLYFIDFDISWLIVHILGYSYC